MRKWSCPKRAGILILLLFMVCRVAAYGGMTLFHSFTIPVEEYGLKSVAELTVDRPDLLEISLKKDRLTLTPLGAGRTQVTVGNRILATVISRDNGYAEDEISGHYTGDVWTHIWTLVFAFGALTVSSVELRRQIRGKYYHYATPLLLALTILCLFTVSIMLVMGGVPGRNVWEQSFTDIPFTVLMVTLPGVTLFTLAMLVSNISLLRHEGKTWRNLLGSAIGLALIIAVIVLLGNSDFSGSAAGADWHTFVINLLSGMTLWTECKLLAVILCGVNSAKYQPKFNKDYVLILGCKLSRKGGLTPLLRGRVDRALNFAREQERRTGKMPVLIPCGGKGSDELRSEAAAMKDYLLEQGVPEEGIRTEDRSENTWENLKNAKAMMEPGAEVAYATTNYHVFRAGVWAARNGLRAAGMGSKTKWYYWPNAFMREYVALVQANLVHEILMLLFIGLQSGLVFLLMR